MAAALERVAVSSRYVGDADRMVECRRVPTATFRWAWIGVNPGTGQVGGAVYFKRKKDAEGYRLKYRGTPAVVGDVVR